MQLGLTGAGKFQKHHHSAIRNHGSISEPYYIAYKVPHSVDCIDLHCVIFLESWGETEGCGSIKWVNPWQARFLVCDRFKQTFMHLFKFKNKM